MRMSTSAMIRVLKGVKELADQLMEVALREKYMGEKIPEAWLKFEGRILT